MKKQQMGAMFYDFEHEICQYNKIFGKKILLYGAGKVCQIFLRTFCKLDQYEIVGIADKNAEKINIEDFLIEQFDYFKKLDFDYIVISTKRKLASEIGKELVESYKYNKEKIMNMEMFLYYLGECLY